MEDHQVRDRITRLRFALRYKATYGRWPRGTPKPTDDDLRMLIVLVHEAQAVLQQIGAQADALRRKLP